MRLSPLHFEMLDAVRFGRAVAWQTVAQRDDQARALFDLRDLGCIHDGLITPLGIRTHDAMRALAAMERAS
jgi:hypothetical protein